jgi:uncharacterized protein YyaL (SSP411 family)
MPDTSRLADSMSPFLRHGAEQPVDWHPWGEAAFERARAEDRPILLDIGAVWCHWCHVMDRESYEDPDTAALINQLYVPIKVDRDERPDVDARYQRAVQALVGQGGWPLTAFLTPAGHVFHGGTYFPPRDLHGRPSFRRVLRELARVWSEEREKVDEAAAAVRDHLAKVLVAEASPGPLEPGLIDGAVDALAKVYDPVHGGFGGAPKFPNAGALGLLLDRWLDEGTELARGMVRETLVAMVDGGIHDQIGGGFHRYSTDARWIIPHFEKMAYDNGPLLEVLARAAVALDDERLAAAAAGVVDYYRGVAPQLVEAGGFPASQDADIGFDDDGDHWTWTAAEVRAALAPEAAEAAIVHWGVDDPAGAMHLDPERHVLFRARSIDEVAARLDRPRDEVAVQLEEAGRALKSARDARPRPFVDETLYTGWVAMVASGHLAVARHLGSTGAGSAGLRALERLWDAGWADGRGLVHRLGDPDSPVLLGAQAHAARALIDAFEWTQDGRWLARARAVAALVRDRFGHPSGGLVDRPVAPGAKGSGGGVDGSPLDAERLEITDAPEPSPTAVAAESFLRIAALDHDDDLARVGRRVLEVYGGSAPRFAPNAGTYFRAVRWAVGPVTTVAVVEEGRDGRDGRGPLLEAALRAYRPATVVRHFRPGAVEPERVPDAIRAMITGDAPRAYVCAGTACAAPVSTPRELAETLATFAG